MMNENQKLSLFPYEWIIVVLFCLILLSLSLFSLKGFANRSCPEELRQQLGKAIEIEVQVGGAVAKPGIYRLPIKSTLKELLKEAELLSTADLSQINMRKSLANGQVVDIAYRHPITIYLSGAVQYPGEMEILSGTRYCELVEQVEFAQGADLAAIKRRKSFVAGGAKVAVPFRKKNEKGKGRR